MNFLKTDIGKIVGIIAGIALFILIIAVASPNTVNILVNNGENCVLSAKSARKTVKKKRRKDKKDKK